MGTMDDLPTDSPNLSNNYRTQGRLHTGYPLTALLLSHQWAG